MKDVGIEGGGTNWLAHDTPSMWRVLGNQETEAYWRRVAGLRKLADLTSTHLGRLQEYRDRLASAWPPGRSVAAGAFVARLDYLIAHMRQTHAVAAANYQALSAVASNLDGARTRVRTIHDEYVQMARTKEQYESRVEFARASLEPGTTIGPPPVREADLEGLNDRARKVMFELSATLVQAQATLQRPTPYAQKGGSGDRTLIADGAAPTIPTVVALAPSSRQSTGTRLGQSLGNMPTNLRSERTLQNASAPRNAADRPTAGQRGRSERPLPGGSAPSTPLMPLPRISGRTAPAPVRPMEPGSVIGNIMQAPSASSGRNLTTVNPVGGVIGGPASQARSQPIGLAPISGQPGQSARRAAANRGNPDTPWNTAEGVPPVLLPSTETDVDPGPAIGLNH